MMDEEEEEEEDTRLVEVDIQVTVNGFKLRKSFADVLEKNKKIVKYKKELNNIVSKVLGKLEKEIEGDDDEDGSNEMVIEDNENEDSDKEIGGDDYSVSDDELRHILKQGEKLMDQRGNDVNCNRDDDFNSLADFIAED